MNLEQLLARQQELMAATQAIINTAEAEGRDLTPEEEGQIDENTAEFEQVSAKVERAQKVAAMTTPASNGRRAAPANAGARVPAAPRNPQDAARHGFNNFGEFAQCVRAACVNGGNADNRLLNAATTYGSEGVGADGGFAVPPEFRRNIWQKVMGEENLISRTDQLVTSSNSLTLPKDETTPWQSTGGIQAYWDGEAGSITQSKPALGQESIRLNKLTALVPVTEELLEDAPGMEAYLRAKAPLKMAAKLNTAIFAGTGAGQPLGILNSPALVSVAKEGGQAADTILYANIVKMWSRLYGPSRQNAVWLINQDIEPQLMQMAFVAGAASPVPAYLPANGLAGQPYGTLMGRPVIPVQAAKTLGDKGDIVLADLSQYMTATKGTDIRTDVSMHLFFDQALTAYRFIMRVAGQPWWGGTVAPENGSNTLSCFVALDERA